MYRSSLGCCSQTMSAITELKEKTTLSDVSQEKLVLNQACLWPKKGVGGQKRGKGHC